MRVDLMQEILDLNQAFEEVISGLERMERTEIFQTDHVRYARAVVETARVDANREFFENFRAIVEKDARWAYKFRRQQDQKTEDPFDFYLELKEREEARQSKGLPPRALLLPGWDEDDAKGSGPNRANKPSRKKRKKHGGKLRQARSAGRRRTGE